MSDSLRPHESQHARPPCPSPTPGVYSDSCPVSWWCHPAISSSVIPILPLPPIPPSIRGFSSEATLRMRWPKYRSFSFNISPSNEHPALISLRMDWLDLLAVQGTLKSLLQLWYISAQQILATIIHSTNVYWASMIFHSRCCSGPWDISMNKIDNYPCLHED